MFTKKPTALTGSGILVDPFTLLGLMTSDFDRMFEESGWPAFRTRQLTGSAGWSPNLDVFEKDHRLIARIDLHGDERIRHVHARGQKREHGKPRQIPRVVAYVGKQFTPQV